MDYIEALGKIAEKDFLTLQPGDFPDTYADDEDIVEQFHYKPAITVEDGITILNND